MDWKDWLRNGWLTEHQATRQEVADLLGVIDRDILECQTTGLSPDWQLNIAYNAALQVAVTALAAAGYRACREAQHYRVIESLAGTMGIGTRQIGQLQAFRKKRNVSDYERAGRVSQREATEMMELAKKFREELIAWLTKNHAHLLPEAC
jgi:hypothetical protein